MTDPVAPSAATPARARVGTISPRDEALIEFYFREQYRFARSTSAVMFSRAERTGVDSQGRRLGAKGPGWSWQPPERTETGLARYGDDHELLVEETEAGGGYELDHVELVRFAEVSRRLIAVERRSPRAAVALEAYHGERGSRWAVYSQDREDPKTKARIRGTGPGSIAALYALTEYGATFIRSQRAKDGAGAHLTDDEILSNAFAVQLAQPDARRRVRIQGIRDAAEELLREAWTVWNETAPARRVRGRAA